MIKFLACIFFSLVGLFIVVVIGGMIHACFFYQSPHAAPKPTQEISDLQAIKICDDEILTRIPGATDIYFDHETINVITSPVSKTRVITDSVNYVSKTGINIRGIFNCKVRNSPTGWHAEIFTQILMPKQ